MTEERSFEDRLTELHKTAVRLQLSIGGCSCCGSPWVIDNVTDRMYNEAGAIGVYAEFDPEQVNEWVKE